MLTSIMNLLMLRPERNPTADYKGVPSQDRPDPDYPPPLILSICPSLGIVNPPEHMALPHSRNGSFPALTNAGKSANLRSKRPQANGISAKINAGQDALARVEMENPESVDIAEGGS